MSEGAASKAVYRRVVLAVAIALAVIPLVSLLLQAAADEWRAPAVWPQRLGTRGLEAVTAQAGGVREGITGSLVIGLSATALAIAVAWPVARLIGRHRGRGVGVVWALLALPLLVPPVVIGSGLVEAMIRLGLIDTWTGLVIAHLVPVTPYVGLVLAAAFTPELHALEEAAAANGAGPLRRLVHVTLPAVAPTLLIAAALGFLVSWSQYGISLALGAGVPTLPVLLVPYVGRDPQIAAALGIVFLLPAILVLGLGARALRSRRA